MDLQYNGPPEPRVISVWYTGTDTLQTGYALCYDNTQGTEDERDDKRGYYVEKPATANLDDFAGVVHPSSAGVTGPGWVKIWEFQGGGFCDVYTDEDCSNDWNVLLAPQNDSYALGAARTVAENTGVFNVKEGVARSKQKVDRSGTEGLVFCRMGRDFTAADLS